MRKPIFYLSILFTVLVFSLLASGNVSACDSCGSTLARVSSEGKLDEGAAPFFFDFTFEQAVWQKRDPNLAHTLHHQGHDSHDKTREEYYHFSLGANAGKRLSFLGELPFIVRHSLDVDSHRTLGSRQRSEGFGDFKLTGIYKLLMADNSFIGPIAGLKFPTGQTKERDDYGVKFEPELQPGSGSFDPIMGGAFQHHIGRFGLNGNVLYTIRTRGHQHYQFGNLLSSYLYLDYLLNPDSRYFKTKIGLDTTIQNEQKHSSRGVGKLSDSGGTTWLMGPQFSVRGNSRVSVFGNILFPVYQNLGGVHQLVRFVWNAGIKISF